jgi:uncharacterized protein (TIGR02597 family)
LKSVLTNVAIAGTLMSGITSLPAETVSRTNPVGYVSFSCPAGSDTIVSVPFYPTPRWRGKLSAAPSQESDGTFRLTFSGNPAFQANELIGKPHYVYCPDSVGAAGKFFVITAHGANSANVLATAEGITGLANGDAVRVVPAWTLNSLFPPATQSTFHASGGNLLSQRKSELLFFDESTEGQGLAPRRRFFVTTTAWIEAGSYAPAENVIVLPGQAFAIRHPADVETTTFLPFQEVFSGKLTKELRTRPGGGQDTMLAMPRPVSAKLSELSLSNPAFVESPTTAPGDRKDQLMVFDNATAAINKLPSAVYFRIPAGWVKDAPGCPSSDSISLEPAAGVLIRKAASANNGVTWVNSPNYNTSAP